MLDRFEQRLVEVVAVRLPRADVTGVELEDAEAEVACDIGILVLDLLRGSAETFLGQFGDIARLAELVAEIGRSLLIDVLRVEWLGQLNENVPASTAVDRVLSHDRMTCCPGTGKEIQDNVFALRSLLDRELRISRTGFGKSKDVGTSNKDIDICRFTRHG